MAKGNPNSAAVQYKVHLKPTDVGLLVMRRMERPYLDKSAELRRFIELGYAAEQAGFILDGTVLRHAGRMWDTQPNFGVEAQTEAGSTVATPGRQRVSAPRSHKSDPESGSPGAGEANRSSPSESANANPTTTSSLRGNLRGLSG